MYFWIAKQIFISLVLILIFHQIFMFVTKTFTKPKVIDLVNKPTDMYKEIYDTIKNTSEEAEEIQNILPPPDVSTEIPDTMKETMQQELQEYLNDISEDGLQEALNDALNETLADDDNREDTTPIFELEREGN